MKVLLLTTNYHPVIGGAETYAREVARGLVSRGHAVTVFTDGGDGPGTDTVEGGVRVVRSADYRADLDAPDKACWEQMAFCLLGAVERSIDLAEVDVIHANSHDMAVLGSMLKAATGRPLIATLHEFEPEVEPFGIGRCRLVYQYLPIDAHIAVSRFYLDKAARFGARAAELIYLGVDTNRFRPRDRLTSRSQLGVPDDAFLVTCSARLKQRKGLTELIWAAVSLTEKLDNARFVVAGTTSSASLEYAQTLRDLITELGLDERFELWTGLSHDEIPTLLAASDLVVQPSYAEGLGLAVLEAMACGVPVIASDTSGLREIVEHDRTGLCVPPRDPAALAQEMLRMAVYDEDRARLGRAGLEQVRRDFTLDRMIAATEQVYARLTG